MKFRTPLSLVNKIVRSHSRNSNEFERLLVHEDDHSQVKISKILMKKLASTPGGCMDVFVGEDMKKYSLPHKYFFHTKLQELLKKYQGLVFDPRADEPIVFECSTQAFDQLLFDIIKNR